MVPGVGVDHGVPERIIFEVGDDLAGRIKVFAYVAVSIIRWIVEAGSLLFNKEAAHSACALHASTEISAPGASSCRGGAGVFGDAVPAIIHVEGGGAAGGFGDSPGVGVVEDGGGDAVDRGGDQAVLIRLPGHRKSHPSGYGFASV